VVVIKSSVFWDITPCSPRSVDVSEEYVAFISESKTGLLTTCFMLVSCLVYSSTVKTEAAGCSETLIDFQRTA
jgi:hypothetical protein